MGRSLVRHLEYLLPERIVLRPFGTFYCPMGADARRPIYHEAFTETMICKKQMLAPCELNVHNGATIIDCSGVVETQQRQKCIEINSSWDWTVGLTHFTRRGFR